MREEKMKLSTPAKPAPRMLGELMTFDGASNASFFDPRRVVGITDTVIGPQGPGRITGLAIVHLDDGTAVMLCGVSVADVASAVAQRRSA